MSWLGLIRAEFTFVYADIFRRKSLLFMLVAYPYMITAFILLFGASIGTAQEFIRKVGVDPVPFLIVSSFMIMSIIGVVDDILWRPIYDEHMGTMPYVISAPTSRVAHYMAIPLPRLTLVVLIGSTSVIPVLTYYYSYAGLRESLIIMGLGALGAVLFTTLAMVIVGLLFAVAEESWRVLNVIRPLLLVLLGAFYPRFLMPLYIRAVSWALPPSHVVEAIQRLLMGYGGLEVMLTLIGIATALFVLYAPLGSRAITLWEGRKVLKGVKT